MIKSFHNKKPDIKHTYLILEEAFGGVTVRAVHPNGDYVEFGHLLTINKDGVEFHQAVNEHIGIKLEEATQRLCATDLDGRMISRRLETCKYCNPVEIFHQ